ncbi:MAG: nicotinate (nicotinamide) nucleotide adenylyltransferase [Gammaproteobacteria bacterium RIFCSPHIGHO2_12_FULL_38_11]|nr:MAG: nicotinate (nicotinamide) nucleotide adenylyltransferase [Gammaproteobacteria bacterium RIFCSPHIGHO2_12_FULL_38_11]
MRPFGILGGTFNPIHEGHIAIAEHVLHLCNLERIEFVPCFQPPHRDEVIASPENRLNMVKLAIQNHPSFFINDYEIQQQKISYTIDTVSYLRKQNPNKPIFLILGGDAFAHFHEWNEWQKILAAVNIIVVKRFSSNTTKTLAEAYTQTQQYITNNIDDFQKSISGKIYFDNINPISTSATQIRKEIAAGKKNIAGLNKAVYAYILKNKIY